MKKHKKFLLVFCVILMLSMMLGTTAFPAIDLVLAVFFFIKLGMAYFDY